MAATLTLVPNPIAPGGNVRVNGAGFDPAKKVQLALDGSGWTTNYFRPAADGSFHVGINVSTKPKTQSLSARYAGSSTIIATAPLTVAVVVPPVDPPPVIVPPDQPPGKVVEFIGTATQFVTLAKDMTVGTIVVDGLYAKWSAFYDVLRSAAKPLLVKGDCIWDGAGLSNSPPWRIGWSSPAGFTTFDGTFVAQGYRIGKAGIVMAKQFDTLGFHGLTIRDCFGDASIDGAKQWHSHGLYIGSNGPASPRSRNFSAKRLVVEGPNVPSSDPAYRMLNGVQTDGSPNCDGVVITDAKISRCYRGYFLYNSPTGVLVDGGEITDCAATIDNSGINGAQGIVRNVAALRSGPLAPGQGSWRSGQLVSGGGNTSS